MQTLFHCQERESRESSAGIFCIDRFFQLTLMRMKNSLRVATSDYFHYISQSARVRNDRWYSGQRALAIISCESHYIKVEFLKRAGYKKLILNKFNLKMVPRDKKKRNVKKDIKDGNWKLKNELHRLLKRQKMANVDFWKVCQRIQIVRKASKIMSKIVK